MKKKKDIKEKWCPLTGDIDPGDNVIMRAREFWGVKTIVQKNIVSAYRPNKEAIEKARAIYDKWDELQRDPLNLKRLEDYMGLALDTEVQDREKYLKDILLWFWDLKASGLEVFSILAIYESRVAKNPIWPVELLALTEKYSPDATFGKQRRKQIKGWTGRGRAGRDEDELSKKDWLSIAKEYNPQKGEYSNVAWEIIIRLKLPENKHQKISRWLSATFKK